MTDSTAPRRTRRRIRDALIGAALVIPLSIAGAAAPAAAASGIITVSRACGPSLDTWAQVTSHTGTTTVTTYYQRINVYQGQTKRIDTNLPNGNITISGASFSWSTFCYY